MTKQKDSVGVAEVLMVGPTPLDQLEQLHRFMEWLEGQPGGPSVQSIAMDAVPSIQPGDLVAYIPYTDAIIPHGFDKRSIIPVKNVMAIAKHNPDDMLKGNEQGAGKKPKA